MELAYQAGVRRLNLEQLDITVSLPDVFRVLTLGANDVLAEKPDVPVEALVDALLRVVSRIFRTFFSGMIPIIIHAAE